MKLHRRSFKNIVFGSLSILIILAFGIAYYSTSVYQDLTVLNQKEAIEQLLEYEVNEQIDYLQESQKLFAFRLQKEKPFYKALRSNNREALEYWLSQSFQRYVVTSGLFDLQALYVRDKNKKIIAQSVRTNTYLGCQSIQEALNTLSLSERLKTRYAICLHDGNLYSEVVVPIGTLKLKGYIHIVTFVADKLTVLENELQMPIKITSNQNKILFQSKNWPVLNADNLLLKYEIEDINNETGLLIEGAFDLRKFNANVDQAKYRFYGIIILITWITLILVLHFLNKGFNSLFRLQTSATQLLAGEYRLIDDKELPFELESPVNAFNELIIGLQFEAENRNKVESELKQERDFISTTLDSINNAVIVVSTDNIIQFSNVAAENIFSKSKTELIDKKLSDVTIFYNEPTGEQFIENLIEFIQTNSGDENADQTLFVFNKRNESSELEYSFKTMKYSEKVLSYVLIFKDVTEDRKLKRQLHYDAYHDPLTGLLNRFAFKERFSTLIVEETGDNQDHVIAYMDLDQFKVVNDVCGHAAGDQLLNKIAIIFKSSIRKTDVVARLGGDEFGLIFPYCSVEKVLPILETLIKQVVELKFVWDKKVFSVGISIGVAEFGCPDDTLDEQMAVVDAACYAAKKDGGNKIHSYSKDAVEVLAHKGAMNWVANINDAFVKNRFVLYVQKIQAIGTKAKPKHYEILIRYLDDNDKLIEPNAFLPAAERYNLMERVDLYVINTVIAWLKKYQKLNPDLVLSINLSGCSISSIKFQKQLKAIISNCEIDASKLCFEITETTIIADIQKSVSFIRAIKRLGPSFSLDDFGSGLSSFAYLRQFPVDYLKIDGMFMKDILTNKEDFVIVKSITEVGHSFGMDVIAEYVESDQMIDLLKKANVDYAQGHSIGKPIPLKDLELG